MPTKDTQNGILYAVAGEEVFLPFPREDIDTTTLNTALEFEDVYPNYRDTTECTFEVKFPNGMNSNDFLLVLSGICTAEQVVSNNWRRMHGMVMKRRRVAK